MFVCMGNICRSPLAEALFREHVRRRGLEAAFEIRSSGTGGWHVGGGADRRMAATAAQHGLSLEAHCAAQFAAADLERYDWIIVMDKDNLSDVLALDADDAHGHKVQLMRSFDATPEGYGVPDPYYGGPEGFERVYEILERSTARLLEAILHHHRERLGGAHTHA